MVSWLELFRLYSLYVQRTRLLRARLKYMTVAGCKCFHIKLLNLYEIEISCPELCTTSHGILLLLSGLIYEKKTE